MISRTWEEECRNKSSLFQSSLLHNDLFVFGIELEFFEKVEWFERLADELGIDELGRLTLSSKDLEDFRSNLTHGYGDISLREVSDFSKSNADVCIFGIGTDVEEVEELHELEDELLEL